MTLTKKHFIEMAKAASESDPTIRSQVAHILADIGERENANFDRKRFMDACKLNENMNSVEGLSIIMLDAGHDKNGNGRRCYVLNNNVVGFIAAIGETYKNDNGMRTYLSSQGYTPPQIRAIFGSGAVEIPTTYKFYREVLKQYGKG